MNWAWHTLWRGNPNAKEYQKVKVPSWVISKFEASLGYLKPYLQKLPTNQAKKTKPNRTGHPLKDQTMWPVWCGPVIPAVEAETEFKFEDAWAKVFFFFFFVLRRKKIK